MGGCAAVESWARPRAQRFCCSLSALSLSGGVGEGGGANSSENRGRRKREMPLYILRFVLVICTNFLEMNMRSRINQILDKQ